MTCKPIQQGLFAILLLIPLCSCSYKWDKSFFVEDVNTIKKYDYAADIVVSKEGFYFFGYIPFSSGSEDAAREILQKRVKKYYPNAIGVFDYRVVDREHNSLIDWTPSTSAWAKILLPKGTFKAKKPTQKKAKAKTKVSQ